ncbi:MAG: branched-chain amino acid ABC transporter ATP-binding protein/permease [Alphaproteobacteria bacterium]
MSAYDYHLLALAGALAAGAIGWQIIFGLAGCLSLAAGTAMGVGAYASTIAALQWGLPPVIAVPSGALIAALLLGLATTIIGRLESHYFALATLALAEIVVLVATNWQAVTGGANGLLGRPLSPAFDDPAVKACVAWFGALAAAGMFYGFRRTFGAEALALLREQPLAAKAFGISARRIRVLAMTMAGFAGGIGGASHALTVGVVSPDILTFKTMASILIVVIVGGRRSPLAAAVLAIAVIWTPELLRFLEETYLVAYGVILLAAILFLPEGLAPVIQRYLPFRASGGRVDAPSPSLSLKPGHGSLRAQAVTRRFGGLTAIDQLDMTLATGSITGLMGPNGAGKSTLLNVLSGLDNPDAGAITCPPNHRVGRCFQTPALAEELTVFQNILATADSEGAAWAALTAVGLTERHTCQAQSLGQGDRRFLEIARALAVNPSFLLIDEPAAGLTPEERERLSALLRDIASAGVGILIVEHNVRFLVALSNRLICMADGRIIADGPPETVIAAPNVRQAYLGELSQ